MPRRKKDLDDYKHNITTSLSFREVKLIHERRWKVSDLLRDGIASRMKPEVQLEKKDEEINALKAKLQAFERKLTKLVGNRWKE